MKIHQITPNVFAAQVAPAPEDHGCNPSFVTTSEGIVMIDTAMLPTNARIWRDEMEKRGTIRYLVNTEHHIDHTAGNYFFPGTVIAHQGVREILQSPLEKVKTVDAAEAEMARTMDVREYILWEYGKWDVPGLALARDYRVRLPSITFSDRLTVHLGDHTFELIHLPGHTPYQIAVYVPKERVVFTGDNFTNNAQPSFAHCCPLDWLESLKKIQSLDVDFVAPGHGPMGDKKAVKKFAGSIQSAVDKVREFIARGGSKEEAANKISFDGPVPALHAGQEARRVDIIHLYEELSTQRPRQSQ